MESFKVLISFAFLVACSMAVQAAEQEVPPAPVAAAVAPQQPIQGVIPSSPKDKRHALYPLGYAGYPYSAYPYYHAAPYAYSYSSYDDGKYWPGKYEKVVPYRAYPYSYYPYNYYYY